MSTKPVNQEVQAQEPRRVLSAEDILDCNDREVKYVAVPEWGGDVGFVPPSLAEKSNARKMAMMPTGKGGELEVDYEILQATIIVECAVKADGTRLFSAAQLERLKKKNANAIKTLANAILGNG